MGKKDKDSVLDEYEKFKNEIDRILNKKLSNIGIQWIAEKRTTDANIMLREKTKKIIQWQN
jgi:hypothetical protein